jgi:nicotinamide-nucleotide amidase
MRIEIICTGDEVLTGKITNTNFSYMAQKLEDVGLSVYWGTTVGDDREALLSAHKRPVSTWCCTRNGWRR